MHKYRFVKELFYTQFSEAATPILINLYLFDQVNYLHAIHEL